MDLRLAENKDLPRLKAMYQNIVAHMDKNNIKIWNEVYPCAFLQQDIENKRLYVLAQKDDIAAAFALCASNDGEGHLKWKEPMKKAVYIDRLGVNVAYLRQGIGGMALESAMNLARQKDAEYLRLFVVNSNQPAINFYLKNGFTRVEGIYEEKVDDFVLCEYGFEIEI